MRSASCSCRVCHCHVFKPGKPIVTVACSTSVLGIRSGPVTDRGQNNSLWLVCPGSADKLAAHGAAEVVLTIAVVSLEGPVHAFRPTLHPQVPWPGQAVTDGVPGAGILERVRRRWVPLAVSRVRIVHDTLRMSVRRRSPATCPVAFSCNCVKAKVEVRSMAAGRRGWPCSVRTSAMSARKVPGGQGVGQAGPAAAEAWRCRQRCRDQRVACERVACRT